MIAIFLAPVYIALNAYIFLWFMRYMSACSHYFEKWQFGAVTLIIYSFFALSILFAFLFPIRWLKHVSNIWFGMIAYILLTVAFADLVRILLKHVIKINPEKLSSPRLFIANGTICIIIIAALTIYGYFHARHIQVTPYTVFINKECGGYDSMKVVLTADLHLGYNMGNAQMKQMVKKINAQKPDLVVIAGDFFDNDFDALKDPDKIADTLRDIESTCGVYACYGNHDIQEKILAGFTFDQTEKKESDPRMDAFVEDAGIILLRDKGVLIDDSFYLYGRADKERPGRGIEKRKTPAELAAQAAPDKPLIVIDHEPDELDELSEAGVDLDLCGHTHDGQIFPGNITINFFWENAYGYLKKGNMHNIVTSGVGVFGPNMRVGTKSEICSIEIKFKKN
ncbi:MAG: metallophosphoesterase [Eubacteriales bacterium]|nr:metallophosphoesterase [Eubacteriales bacterium]